MIHQQWLAEHDRAIEARAAAEAVARQQMKDKGLKELERLLNENARKRQELHATAARQQAELLKAVELQHQSADADASSNREKVATIVQKVRSFMGDQ